MFRQQLPLLMAIAIGMGGATQNLAATDESRFASSDVQRPASAEAAFLQQAGQAGEAEMALATLAQRQARDPRVKALADLLKRDHEAARTELQKLAKLTNAELTAMTVAQVASRRCRIT